MIELDKPLTFLDVESTGLDVAKDRIISIAIKKLHPDGTTIEKARLVNPERPIPSNITEITKITNEMVINEPPFRLVARGIYNFIHECDLVGFNSNNFDIPILCEEFLRCGIDFPKKDTRFIDVGNIYKKKEARTLTAAYKFYCNQILVGAHDAIVDVNATFDVLKAQLETYDDLPKTTAELAEFSSMGKRADFAGKIGIDDDGDYIYNIGKSKGLKVKNDLSFAYWMLDKDFPLNTIKVVKSIINEIQGYECFEFNDFK